MGMPHSMHTRIRCFGWFFEKSFEKIDIMTTAEGLPSVDAPPVSGMRRIKGPGGLQNLPFTGSTGYSDPSARPIDT